LPTETRYFRSDYVLGTSQTLAGTNVYLRATGYLTGYVGFRIFKVVGGVETELTSDIVFTPVTGPGYNKLQWNAPNNVDFDKIRVKVYLRLGTGAWTLKATFDTETINGKLQTATWDIWAYCDYIYVFETNRCTVYFYFGASVYNSRIENFTWTPAIVAKKPIMNGLVYVE
jgi:hypothetical protein